MNYFWIRVYDYQNDRDQQGKGIMLDEFYIKDVTREAAKEDVRNRYTGKSQSDILFVKPKKRNGLYAIVMESNEFFYNRFTIELDTFCFNHTCHKKIVGKMGAFPKTILPNLSGNSEFVEAYFCSYDCMRQTYDLLRGSEGEWQTKEEGLNGDVFGYIYHIYNRLENTHYIGQTRYLPFFRWQEHVKSHLKGNINDMVFSVITEVRRNPLKNNVVNQQVLNSVEAWWIAKYREDGYDTINISQPRITVADLKYKFDEMVTRVRQEVLDLRV